MKNAFQPGFLSRRAHWPKACLPRGGMWTSQTLLFVMAEGHSCWEAGDRCKWPLPPSSFKKYCKRWNTRQQGTFLHKIFPIGHCLESAPLLFFFFLKTTLVLWSSSRVRWGKGLMVPLCLWPLSLLSLSLDTDPCLLPLNALALNWWLLPAARRLWDVSALAGLPKVSCSQRVRDQPLLEAVCCVIRNLIHTF